MGGDSFSRVSSLDHEVVIASDVETDDPDTPTSLYAVPATSGLSTVVFMVRNLGPLPARIVDVWPDPESGCLWTPSRRELRDDPQGMFSDESVERDAVGATIQTGQAVTIWITGALPDPDLCRHEALTWRDNVLMTLSVAGHRSTVVVPLGYRFGYTDDPARFLHEYETMVISPDLSELKCGPPPESTTYGVDGPDGPLTGVWELDVVADRPVVLTVEVEVMERVHVVELRLELLEADKPEEAGSEHVLQRAYGLDTGTHRIDFVLDARTGDGDEIPPGRHNLRASTDVTYVGEQVHACDPLPGSESFEGTGLGVVRILDE